MSVATGVGRPDAERRVLCVGQAPARSMAADDPPFHATDAFANLARGVRNSPSTAVGERFDHLAGFHWTGFYADLDWDNLSHEYPGRVDGGPGDVFTPDMGRTGAARVWDRILAEHRIAVVAVGRTVATCLGCPASHPFFQPVRIRTDRGTVSLMPTPHPSGLTRWWRDPANAAEGGDCWAVILTAAAHGVGAATIRAVGGMEIYA